jgi:hypothetical protein
MTETTLLRTLFGQLMKGKVICHLLSKGIFNIILVIADINYYSQIFPY